MAATAACRGVGSSKERSRTERNTGTPPRSSARICTVQQHVRLKKKKQNAVTTRRIELLNQQRNGMLLNQQLNGMPKLAVYHKRVQKAWYPRRNCSSCYQGGPLLRWAQVAPRNSEHITDTSAAAFLEV